jgi:Kef-type K+ transport system membrane component KefB
MLRLKGDRVSEAAAVAAAKAGCIVAAVCWLTGVGIFGFVTGPDPTSQRGVLYALVSSPPSVAVLAVFLRREMRERARRSLPVARAVAVAAVSFAPIQAAILVITLTRQDHDMTVALSALAAAAALFVFLSEILTPR